MEEKGVMEEKGANIMAINSSVPSPAGTARVVREELTWRAHDSGLSYSGAAYFFLMNGP